MNQYDLPLNKNISAQFVPIIIALMVYLGTLCFVFMLFMVYSSFSWEKQLTTHLSIEIPTLRSDAGNPLDTQVLQILKKVPAIEQATVVPQKEMASLFRSLLGKEIDIDIFSLPVLIDVSLKNQAQIDLEALENTLKKISPHIHVTDHRSWQTQVSNLIYACVFTAFFITILIILAALATAIFATKTSLLIHREVIEILNLIGATDSYIAKQFQTYAFKQSLVASLLGSSFGFLTFFGLTLLLEKAGFPFTLESSFFSQTLLIFGLAPFIMAYAIMVSVRIAVMKVLRS